MKTIKITMTFLLMSFGLTGYSQLNPITNLSWNHWYSMPYNFYELYWASPEPSNDTLIGYNIYRDSELYRFQTTIGASHIIHQDTSFGGEAFVHTFDGAFYIHVTAVYNSNHIESIYNDSALCGGAMMNINNLENEKIIIVPHPINDNSIIHINFPDRKIEYITIISPSGQLISKIIIESNEAIIKVSDMNLKDDLYFLLVYGDNYFVTRKFVKIK
ncbi:MAG: T9SS type A sorting domain-containing protein [Bacteroidetes bacterium]|nr:T9SS type A sorting domain-containing protein [Bacteroidota bacterium]